MQPLEAQHGELHNHTRPILTFNASRTRCHLETASPIRLINSFVYCDEMTEISITLQPEPGSASDQVAMSANGQRLAKFTTGCRTVLLYGSQRELTDAHTDAIVAHNMYVRLLPEPFTGELPFEWLRSQLSSTEPDILALALQYGPLQENLFDTGGVLLAGDASYGPLREDEDGMLSGPRVGRRRIGADFHDFMQVSWTAPDGELVMPRAEFAGCLDCSGFVRMVFGWRSGMPLSIAPQPGYLPRYSWHMWWNGPGRTIIDAAEDETQTERDEAAWQASGWIASSAGVVRAEEEQKQAPIPDNQTAQQVWVQSPDLDLSLLAPGDLVFFQRSTKPRTNHVGVFMGLDDRGDYRFVHSRTGLNGPTFGDDHESSILNGTAKFARQFRGARRL